MAIALQAPALAQTRYQQLIQQSVPFGQPLPASAAGPGGYQPLPNLNNPGAERYIVYVDSDSPLLLDQVKRVEPGAFRRVYNNRTVIQAGLFYNPARAQQRVRELEFQGIGGAQIVAVSAGGQVTPVTAGAGGPAFGATSSAVNNAPVAAAPPALAVADAYFVVVPGKPRELPLISQQILRLGAQQEAVFERTVPLGPHVAVGPFSERGAAETWSTYLRDFGLDARVYFGR